MKRVPFDHTYRAPYPQVSRAVRCGDLIFTSGQLDVDGHGRLQHEGDLQAETRRSLSLLYDAVEQAGGSIGDLAYVQVFCRDPGNLDTAAFRHELYKLLPDGCRPVLVLTPIETFPKGVQVEVDALAWVGGAPERIERDGVCAARVGDLIFAHVFIERSAGSPQPHALEHCLHDLGATLGEVVKLRYYASSLSHQLQRSERQVLDWFPRPGPVYTRLPIASVGKDEGDEQIEVVAVVCGKSITERGSLIPDEELISPWGLTNPHAIRAGRYVFVGGQLPVEMSGRVSKPGLIKSQIAVVMDQLMRTLSAFDLSLSHVAKVNAYHQGREDRATWTENVQTRANYYPSPGPASTGVEVSTVGFRDALITVECVALDFDLSLQY